MFASLRARQGGHLVNTNIKEGFMRQGSTGRLIGRRKFIQLGAAAGATAFLLGATGCSPAQQSDGSSGAAHYTPGTYTAQAQGKQSPVAVEVTFGESSIDNIKVTHHNETERIANAAIDGITTDVLELQSLNVDTVSGATLTSMALLSAIKDCVSQAGGNVSDLEKAAGREKKTDTETLDVDVAVIGSGAAGLSSAIALAEEGANVVLMEKSAFMGGSMLVSGGRLQYPESPLEFRQETSEPMKKLFEETMARARAIGVAEEKVSQIEQAYADWYAQGNTKTFDSDEFYALSVAVGGGSPVQAENTLDSELSRKACEWMTSLGVELEQPVLGIMGFPWPRSTHPVGKPAGEGYVEALENYINGGTLTSLDMLFSTSAKELITENGSVVGVKAECTDGTAYEIHASRGVLLATGGYTDSPKWLAELQPQYGFDSEETIHTVAPSGHGGEGLDMAQSVGASVTSIGMAMLNPYAHPKYFIVGHIIGDTGNPLVVNKEGKRFVNETATRTELALAVKEQPDELCYVIACEQNSNIKSDGRNFDGELVEGYLENGVIFKADTLDDLAAQIDVPADALKRTVEDYNAACVAGVPDEFGRTYFEENAPIVDGPFYASPGTWAVLITLDGLTVDAGYRVLDDNKEPIPGLYAVGEVCGLPCLQNLGYGGHVAASVLA